MTPDANGYTYHNGIYEGASYHHANSNGKKSPAPPDGQKALDKSIRVKSTSLRRVAIFDDFFVVLDSSNALSTSGEPLYHGHIRTYFEDLDRDTKNILKRLHLVNKKTGKLKNNASQCSFCN